jgi:tRNA (adenine37-N6)-methyltransferase
MDAERTAPEWVFRAIGRIRTPFPRPEGTPIQGAARPETEGSVEVFPEFAPGLADVQGFSHLILLYAFDHCQGYDLCVTPFLDTQEHGIFATRSPRRPNPLGMTVVRLLAVEGTTLRVSGVDMVDGTPLLDIKPYVPAFDIHPADRVGWFEHSGLRGRPPEKWLADGRFSRDGTGGQGGG